MKHAQNACRAAFAAGLIAFAAPAFAAAPDALDPDTAKPSAEFQLDTVLVVHNWILCTAQPFAESIARARAESREAGERAYADLAAAKSCGRFEKLGVLLRTPLYRPAIGSGGRVFAAEVNIGVGWQAAFVVSGDLPQE